jgi:beta-fructofuranosidase
MRLFGFKPEDGAAAGDAMPFFWNGEWHVFYLKPPSGAWGYPARTRNSLGHIVSKDLVDWKALSDAFGPGPVGSPDAGGIWTGSLIEHEGTFHFFYTGYNPELPNPQQICKATSDDLVHWTKEGANPLFGPDNRWYEPTDWRDPFIFRNEDRHTGFTMLIAAREKAGPVLRRGCIAAASSPDLESWEVSKPLYTPRLTHVMECPELFRLGGYWYLVFSRYSEQAQTLYRVARSPDGPWQSRPLDSIDGRRFYAAKSASDGARRISFAWTHERTHYEARAEWEWGGHFASPRELISLPEGTLISRLPTPVRGSYSDEIDAHFFEREGNWQRSGRVLEGAAPGSYGYGFVQVPREEILIETEIEIAAGTTAAGLLIEAADDLSAGFAIAIEPLRQRVVLNRWPQPMDPLWQRLAPGEIAIPEADNPLVERHLPILPANGRYQLRLLRKESLLECFVAEQVALTYRIYEKRDQPVGLFVAEGTARFTDLTLHRG